MRPTSVQIKVLQLLRDGCTAKDIANVLSISLNTVKNHVADVHSRLGVLNSTHAVVIAIRLGYISLDGDTIIEVNHDETE